MKFLLLALLVLPSLAQSREVESEEIRITIADGLVVGEERDKSIGTWKKTCEKLGNRLVAQGGVWGQGFFTKFACSIEDEFFVGEKKKYKWDFRITYEEDEHLAFSFWGPGIKGKAREYKIDPKIKVERVKIAPYLLGEQKIIDLLSVAILEHLPARYYFKSYGELKASGKLILVKDSQEAIAPPKQIAFFHLDFDENSGFWRPTLVGMARTKSNGKNKQEVKYQIKTFAGKYQDPRPIWGWPIKSDNNATKQLSSPKVDRLVEKVNDTHATIVELVTDNFSSGFIGVRAGFPVNTSDPLVRKMNFYGLLGEFRGGMLEGLRVYFDMVPKTKDTFEQEQYEMKWNRTVLGWSFGLDWDLGILSRIDLAPKIGVWNLDARVPNIVDGEVDDGASFKISNGLALGFEAGIENDLKYLLYRFWGAGDFSAIKQAGNDISTLRAGTDLWIAGPSLGKSTNLSFLLFFLFEQVKLNRDVDSSDEIAGIEFQQNYLGLGVSVAW